MESIEKADIPSNASFVLQNWEHNSKLFWHDWRAAWKPSMLAVIVINYYEAVVVECDVY